MPERCIDASLAAKWYIRGESHRDKALHLLYDSLQANITLIAPPLFEQEIDGIVQSRFVDGRATAEIADRTLEQIDGTPVRIIEHPEARRRARQIARLTNQRKVYDATYAALAELRGCDFWTADKSFYDAANAAFPFVKYFLHYS